ncbi:MAG: ribosome-recycling factor [Bacteroides sp. SM23_62_1]|nr:MAG: ribosome-recycling factor [Bacteroides sp. SM23_62_1]
MDELVELILEDTRAKMEKSISHLENELIIIRAGKANPHMLDGIMINYYGAQTPLNQVSNIGTPDPRTLAIQPWDRSMIETIEKAIMQANIGLNPINNGEIIRINVPPLTEERRRDLVKQVKTEGENTKIGIRSARRDANEELKKMKKEGLAEDAEKIAQEVVQKITDEFIEQIDRILEAKEKDIMTV